MSKLSTEYGLLASAIDPKLSTEYAVSASPPPVAPFIDDSYVLGSINSDCKMRLYADFDLSQSFTISFWVWTAPYGGHTYFDAFFPMTALFESTHVDKTYSTYYPAGLQWSNRNNTPSSGNPDYFGFSDWSSNTFVGYYHFFTAGENNLSSGWKNIMVTWDSAYYSSGSISQPNAKAGLTYYINNVAVPKTTDYNAGGSINPSSFQFTGIAFGRHIAQRSTNAYYHGKLNDVSIWTSHIVTSQERGLIYNSGIPADVQNTSGLTSPTKYWKFENADTTLDSVSNTSSGHSQTMFKTNH